MPVIPPSQLAYLRDQHPQTARVEWYLAVAPYGDACFTAQVNDGAIARGARAIVYDGDVGENNVSGGMTLWVGSAPGLDDIGRVRVRWINAVANSILVAENTDIAWADDLFLTCPGAYGFREIWGKYPRMTEVGGAVDFFMDYDDDFTNPTDTVIPPKANAGPPAVGWIDPVTGVCDLSFNGDTSFTTEVGAAIALYAWDFEDGTWQSGPGVNAAGTCANPNVVRWTTPGFRYISLTVTDNTAQARTGTMYVPVWIFEEGVEDPYELAEIVNQDCSIDNGWKATLRVFQPNTTDEDIIYRWSDGALVVLFTKTWFGNICTGVGGWCMASDKHYRDNIRFVGWLNGETLQYNSDVGVVEFEAVSHDGIMRMIPGFSFTIEDATPTEWHEVNDLNVDRALHFLLEYYSTVNKVCTVMPVGEGANRTLRIQKFSGSSLYDQAQEDLLQDAHCLLLSAKTGVLIATRDPQFRDAAGRAFVDVACHLQQANGDWMNAIDMDKPHRPSAGECRLGGVAYSTPLLSQCPIATPGDIPTVPLQSPYDIRPDGFILRDQAEANLWSGLTLTNENNEYRDVPLDLTGYWPVFDPAYQEYIELTATDPLTRKSWVQEKFIVREMQFTDGAEAGTSQTSLVLEKTSEIMYGETVTVPDEPEPEPPFTPPVPLLPPTVPPPGPVKMTVAWTRDCVGWTADFLLHHTFSIVTDWDLPTLIFEDNTQDFVTAGIAVGDVVENMSSGVYENTTVAAVIDATHIELVADINLIIGSDYHVCGTQWVDITPAAMGAHEYIIQFLYVRTGVNTVAGWVLTNWDGVGVVGTQGRVFFTADILTATPVWSTVKQLSAVQVDIGQVTAQFRGMAVYAGGVGYCIVRIVCNVDDEEDIAMYTNNSGGAWAYSTYPIAHFPSRRCGHFSMAIDQLSGTIYNLGYYRNGAVNEQRLWISTDGGANFAADAAVLNATLLTNGNAARMRIPYAGGVLYAVPTDSGAGAYPASPNRYAGGVWTYMGPPAGYDVGPIRTGMTGWYGDVDDVVTMFHLTGGGVGTDWHLHRSIDGGASFAFVADADPLFTSIPIGWGGCTAIPVYVWENDADVIFWVGLAPYAAPGADACRIRFTDDGGLNWFNKMGNWTIVFGDWTGVFGTSGASEGTGCTPLPRVGANSA